MATVNQPSKENIDCTALVEEEIAAARTERRPVSRQALANLVQKRTGMPPKDALAIVDAFCDEKEPALPVYLESEFVIGWLKVLAIGQAVVGIVFFYYASKAHQRGEPIWVYLMLGTVFIGIAALCWVQSLEREVRNRDK
jgi:hypothetical protein